MDLFQYCRIKIHPVLKVDLRTMELIFAFDRWNGLEEKKKKIIFQLFVMRTWKVCPFHVIQPDLKWEVCVATDNITFQKINSVSQNLERHTKYSTKST